MSTRKRNSKTKTVSRPLTPDQIQDRINELQAIGVKAHHALAAKSKCGSLRGGLWRAVDFLPNDLKAEWDALHKKAA